MNWIEACSVELLKLEEAIRFDYQDKTYAIFQNHLEQYFCTDGFCTHEEVHLSDGLAIENTVECPMHASIFNISTGVVETPPACLNLNTYNTGVPPSGGPV